MLAQGVWKFVSDTTNDLGTAGPILLLVSDKAQYLDVMIVWACMHTCIWVFLQLQALVQYIPGDETRNKTLTLLLFYMKVT